MTTLAVYGFGHNVNKIMYPWRESLGSALALADAVYFAECDSDDGTLEDAYKLFSGYTQKPGQLNIIKHPWGDHHTIQAHIANALLDEIGEHYDYAMKLDMDEVLCEWSFERFRKQLTRLQMWGVVLAKPHYVHFCPDFETTFPFIYDSKAVICRTNAKLRYRTDKGGDACALSTGRGQDEYQTGLELFHYGKTEIGRERESLYKEVEFQKLYSHKEDALGFPDPRVVDREKVGYMDYSYVFDDTKRKGGFKKFDGQHPVFVQGWIAQMKERHEKFLEELRAIKNVL